MNKPFTENGMGKAYKTRKDDQLFNHKNVISSMRNYFLLLNRNRQINNTLNKGIGKQTHLWVVKV